MSSHNQREINEEINEDGAVAWVALLCITVWLVIGMLLAKTVTIKAVDQAADELTRRDGGAYCEEDFMTLMTTAPQTLKHGILAGKRCLPPGGDHASALDVGETPAALCALLATLGRHEDGRCN